MKQKKELVGFSFIEVIVAVFLVSTGMIVIMSLMASTLRETISSRDQTTAVLLAQEGAELVRNLRDNNWAVEASAFENDFPNSSGNNYRIDINSGDLSSAVDFKLYLNGSDIFSHTPSATESNFRRKIEIEYYDTAGAPTNRAGATSAEVVVMVVWKSADFPISLSDCTTAESCVFSQTTLSSWSG